MTTNNKTNTDNNQPREAQVDREYCRGLVQKILNQAHPPGPKRIIQDNPDGLQFADPIGGDSSKNPYEKRAHLYWNSFYVICYDDEGYKIPFTKLCSTFKVNLSPDQRQEIYHHIDNNITYSDSENEFLNSTFDELISLDDLTEVLNSGNTDSQLVNIKPIQPGSRVEYYLHQRRISNFKNIYQGEYYRNPEWKEPVMVILNRKDNHLLGIQIRNLKSGYKRMFKIYNYEHLLKWVSPGKIDEVDLNKLVLYNKLSYLYNILNINFNSKITIFEGYLDSIFYPNSIGVTGVNSDVKFLENNNLDLQFFYDNDEAGWRKSEQKIKAGFPVFLWKKLFESITNMKKSNDPYSLYYRISKVKDLNKLAEIVPNPYQKLKLPQYFSSDRYDIKYLPKVKSKWNWKTKHNFKKYK